MVGGGYPNQTPYLNKNDQRPKMEQRHRERGDLTCESGNAYLHANYVTRRGERVESAPHAPDRERAREERHSRHKRETRGRATEQMDKQTKESKGTIDAMGN